MQTRGYFGTLFLLSKIKKYGIIKVKGGTIMKMLKRLFCKHKHLEYVKTDLEKKNNGHWKTKHNWRCKDCGKIM